MTRRGHTDCATGRHERTIDRFAWRRISRRCDTGYAVAQCTPDGGRTRRDGVDHGRRAQEPLPEHLVRRGARVELPPRSEVARSHAVGEGDGGHRRTDAVRSSPHGAPDVGRERRGRPVRACRRPHQQREHDADNVVVGAPCTVRPKHPGNDLVRGVIRAGIQLSLHACKEGPKRRGVPVGDHHDRRLDMYPPCVRAARPARRSTTLCLPLDAMWHQSITSSHRPARTRMTVWSPCGRAPRGARCRGRAAPRCTAHVRAPPDRTAKGSRHPPPTIPKLVIL